MRGSHRAIAVVLAAILAHCGDAGCGDKGPPEDWVARVEALTGSVQASLGSNEKSLAARLGTFIRVGGKLVTGPSGEANLGLRNGGRLRVKPNSVVTFGPAAPNDKLTLELQHGSVVGTAAQIEAGDLVIGVGSRKVRLANLAKATVAVPEGGAPQVVVEFGQATVEGPEGEKQTIIAGRPMTLVSGEPDAGVPDAGAPDAIRGTELVYYLKPLGQGQVLVKGPDDARFQKVRRGRVVQLAPASEVRIPRRASVVIGTEPGEGTTVSGPARFALEGDGGKPLVRLAPAATDLHLRGSGKPGSAGSAFVIEGVRLTPLVRHVEYDVAIHRAGKGRAKLNVRAGAVGMQGAERVAEAEAGQYATLSRGKVAGPGTPPMAALQLRHGGTLRVFATMAEVPITLRYKLPEGTKEALVEVSRSPSMRRPIFADRIRREHLTLPKVRRGRLYFRVRPLTPQGELQEPLTKGQILVLRDTSHRMLKNRRTPRNTIRLGDRDTVVYYQNLVPRFTFEWPPMSGASSYQVKVLHEQDLTRPLVNTKVRQTSIRFRPGKIGEGSYLWYIVGRDARGRLVRATKERRLTIKYDNATPDLQIKQPRDGLTVADASIEARGVTIPRSRVTINGQPVELDKAFRFMHSVALKPGPNVLIFRVHDKRRGTSVYVRRVVRK